MRSPTHFPPFYLSEFVEICLLYGLAIISGTIGYKVTRQIVKEEKFKSLLLILFSFFYIGRFVGINSYFSLAIRLPFMCIFT